LKFEPDAEIGQKGAFSKVSETIVKSGCGIKKKPFELPGAACLFDTQTSVSS